MKKETPPITISAQEYKASDLLKLVGLTYRQLHDWDIRAGVISPERASPDGWRRYSLQEVLALATCGTLRRQFAISLEQVRDLYRWLMGEKRSSEQNAQAREAKDTIEKMKSNRDFAALLEKESDSLQEALKDDKKLSMYKEYLAALIKSFSTYPIEQSYRYALAGFPVYLIGLEAPAIMTDIRLVEFVSRRNITKPTIICPLNSIFNEILPKIKQQPLGQYTKSFTEHLRELNKRADITDGECELIRFFRERDHHCVTLHIKGREVLEIDVEEELSKDELKKMEESLLKTIGSQSYQTITITEKGGKIARIHRKIPIKLG